MSTVLAVLQFLWTLGKRLLRLLPKTRHYVVFYNYSFISTDGCQVHGTGNTSVDICSQTGMINRAMMNDRIRLSLLSKVTKQPKDASCVDVVISGWQEMSSAEIEEWNKIYAEGEAKSEAAQ